VLLAQQVAHSVVTCIAGLCLAAILKLHAEPYAVLVLLRIARPDSPQAFETLPLHMS
jgi:hypothetical protein